MMPPNCCLCDNGLETGHECELIGFHRTPEQEVWHAEVDLRPLPDHPPDCDWFCEDHVDTARSFIALDRDQALEAIRSRETWMVMQIDLFDRDTPPMLDKQGVGLECGLFEFWSGVLGTVDVDGNRFPMDYRLSVGGQATEYSIQRHDDNLVRLKQAIESDKEPADVVRRLANAQARSLRSGNVSGAHQWLADLYRHLTETGDPESFLANA